MVPNVTRGHSFKGLTAYLAHDKRETRPDGTATSRPQTRERVGFVMLLNLDGEAETPEEAARVMAATARSAGRLKRAAGVKMTGNKATAAPVWHCSLSWAIGEQVSQDEKIAAAHEALAAAGLGIDLGYQTVITEHTDTDHQHVHIMVNLVHPLTGKQANPFRDRPKLQQWARSYEKRRGKIYCRDRERKYADIETGRTGSPPSRFRKAANENKQKRRGAPGYKPKADRYGRDRTKAREPRTAFRHAAQTGDTAVNILTELTAQHSTFTRRDLARHIWTRCADADEFRNLMAQVEACPLFVRLGKDTAGDDRFTARDLFDIERQMLADALHLHTQHGHPVSQRHKTAALNALPFTLSDDQDAAFRHVTGPELMAAVVGLAGTGKTTMLGAARAAWERQGCRVFGAALGGVAADGLRDGAGIESATLHKRLQEWDAGENLLQAGDVLVIDEAGMLGSRLLARALAHARKAGAKVVLVGDPEQLQAIEAGAAFRAIIDRIGAAKISSIRRQKEEWQRAATVELATEQTEAALDRYDAADMVHSHDTDDDAKVTLIDKWNETRAAAPDRTQIILAGTRAEVRELNDLARVALRASGDLGMDHTINTAAGERSFATGDRAYFLKNNKRLDVRNGTLGTIEAIDGDIMTIRLDGDGRRVTFSVAEYGHIDHGYAATVHKSQGITVDAAHILASRMMDRHAAYVAMTRHRYRLDLHWSRAAFASPETLARTLGRKRAKDTTLDYAA